jgi:hypothetical protein
VSVSTTVAGSRHGASLSLVVLSHDSQTGLLTCWHWIGGSRANAHEVSHTLARLVSLVCHTIHDTHTSTQPRGASPGG